MQVRPGELLVLCGPAGCGKTTWAHRRFSAEAVVSSDDCRRKVCGDPADQGASPAAFALFHTTLALRLAMGRISVADSTALDRFARRKLLGLARDNGAPTTLILFDLPPQLCRQRNAARDRAVPEADLLEQLGAMRSAVRGIDAEGWDRTVRLAAERQAEELEVLLP